MHENITGCYYTVRIKKNLTMQAQHNHNVHAAQVHNANQKCNVCISQVQCMRTTGAKTYRKRSAIKFFFFVSTVACSETRSLRSKHAQKHRESPQTVNLGRVTCEVKSQRPKISAVNGQTAEKSRSRLQL